MNDIPGGRHMRFRTWKIIFIHLSLQQEWATHCYLIRWRVCQIQILESKKKCFSFLEKYCDNTISCPCVLMLKIALINLFMLNSIGCMCYLSYMLVFLRIKSVK